MNSEYPVVIREIAFGSADYRDAVALRYRVLRAPLGLDFKQEDLDKEYLDYHIAAFQQGVITGILLMLPKEENGIIKMRQVAVDNPLQGKGIGSLLVGFSEDFAREKEFKSIELHAREAAVPFYLRLNYRIIGDRFTEVGIPHVKMVKDL